MKKPLRVFLIILFSVLFAYSAVNLFLIEKAYRKADNIYAEGREQYVTEPSAASSAVTDGWPAFTVDLASLQQVNPDVIGWLYLPNTNISYPLLRATDNKKYLHKSYDLQSTASGSIFMDDRNTADLTDDNTVIYGHNMKNGGMFGSLKKFADTEYLKQHTDVYVFLPGRVLRYRAFAGYRAADASKSYTLTFTDDFRFPDFLDYIRSSAGHNFVDGPEQKTTLLTLSTCTSAKEHERFVIHAVYVGEKTLT